MIDRPIMATDIGMRMRPEFVADAPSTPWA